MKIYVSAGSCILAAVVTCTSSLAIAAPTITSISPSSGATSGGSILTIVGSNFGASGNTAMVGTRSCSITVEGTGQIRCIVPAGSGAVNAVVVTDDLGTDSNSHNYAYNAPSLASLNPSSGPAAGGNVLTINGNNFATAAIAPAAVTVDSASCTVTAQNHTSIECIVPPGSGSDVDVAVMVDGQSSGVLAYDYLPPSISSISPTSGATSGGMLLTISGSNFSASGNSATVGGSTCPISMQGPTSIVCSIPPGSGASNDVQVTDSAGVPSNTQNFAYDPPSLASLNPSSGPAAGGNVLTINGNNFATAAIAPAAVTVDGNLCPVDVQTHTSIRCTVPPGSGSGVDVAVLVDGQASGALLYDYIPPPSISAVIPSSGSTTGGIVLTIFGSNFSASGNSAAVGGADCPITAEGLTTILCTLPEGTGADQEVEVTNSGGTGSNLALFDYDPPSIVSLNPTHAPTSGSVPITLTGSNFGPAGADPLRSVTVGTSTCPLLPSSSDHDTIVCTLPAGQGLGRTVDVVVDSQPSNTAIFDYDGPSIALLTPADAPTAGGTVLTINGQNFGLTATVTVDGSACPVGAQAHAQLQCTVPPGSGSDVPVVVDVSGQQAMSTFDYRDPACGDGIVDPDEDCDDSDSEDLDGCSAACETEHIEDRDQAGCIVAMNKAGAGVLKAQAKNVAACARDAETGVPCIGVTSSSALARALEKVVTSSDLKCGSTPHFGVAPVPTVQDTNRDETVELARDMFGADPDAALVPDAMAPNRASCQQHVLKTANNLMVAYLKAFGKCKKLGLKDEVIRAPSQLGFCLPEVDDEVLVTKATQKLFDALADSCVNVSEDLVAAFPGECSAAEDVGACIEDLVRCRSCRALSSTDALDYDCDGRDDDLANGSCP